MKTNAQTLGPCDLMPAGQAMRLGVTLATHNPAEFHHAPDLAIDY